VKSFTGFVASRGGGIFYDLGANIGMVTVPLAQERGQLRFETSHYNCGDHHLSADGSLVVQAVRLDDYPPRGMPVAVQIDCQRAEPAIIKGGVQALGKANLIVCEFWPWGMRHIGLSPGPILDFVSGQFPFAQVLHHDQPTGAPLRAEAAIGMLRKLIDDDGKYAQADLVLIRE
jgi:hypothetical protein